jgi:4-amino-4-deoxy-L-arabinose transferase-like glycosyltransferase
MLVVAVLGGAGVALAWALPAAISGGEEFARAIFLGQTTGRVAGGFSHARPFWWYGPMLLLLLFPWVLWPTLWRGLYAADWRRDPGMRFAAVWFLAALLILSSFTDKQPHYFLAVIPAFALLAARALTTVSTFEAPSWATVLPLIPTGVIGVALVVISLRPDILIDLVGDTPLAIGHEPLVAGAGILISIVIGLGVVGRHVDRQVPAWFEENPDGVAIYLHRRREDVADGTAIHVQPFRGRWLAIWDRAGADLAPEIFTR